MNSRPARIDDAPSLAALVGQLGYSATPQEVSGRLARLLARPDQRFIVAEADGRLLGWVHVQLAEYVDSGLFALIAGLVVDRDHRRRGIGAALMAEAESWARAQGCSLVRLSSSTSRVPAHRFYEEQGYAIVKTQYSFAKPLAPEGAAMVSRLVPRAETETP